MKSRPTHRVVVTGMGAITPYGIGVPVFWNALLEGRSAVALATRYDITDFPYVIAAEVHDFDPRDFMDAKAARRMARFAQFAVAAAGEAIRDSGLNLDTIDRTRIAVDIGTSLGGTAEVEEQTLAFMAKGRKRVDAFYMPTFIYNMASCQVAIQYGLHGPTTTPVLACATGAYAIGEAARMVHWGEALVAICGGTDAGVTALNAMAFGSLAQLRRRVTTPRAPCARSMRTARELPVAKDAGFWSSNSWSMHGRAARASMPNWLALGRLKMPTTSRRPRPAESSPRLPSVALSTMPDCNQRT
jgi:3-oxoacyl-[acyl-carrier-protein] synthase II